MADEPIPVSSTAWTGLPADPVDPDTGLPVEGVRPPEPEPKDPPSPLKVIAGSILLIAIGAFGTWQAIATGTATPCRHCAKVTADHDPVQYGLVVLVLLWCIPVGLGLLMVGIRDARRQFRGSDESAAGGDEERPG